MALLIANVPVDMLELDNVSLMDVPLNPNEFNLKVTS